MLVRVRVCACVQMFLLECVAKHFNSQHKIATRTRSLTKATDGQQSHSAHTHTLTHAHDNVSANGQQRVKEIKRA